MRKILSLLAVLVLSSVLAFAQSRIVTGKVVDESGNPISFATIKIKNSNKGVSADENGNFSIEVGNARALVVSSTSYGDQEVSIQGISNINIQLTSMAESIDEVVVTAGGIRSRKREEGYNSTVVNSQQLTQAKPLNVASGLTGKVAGLQVIAINGGVNPTVRLVL